MYPRYVSNTWYQVGGDPNAHRVYTIQQRTLLLCVHSDVDCSVLPGTGMLLAGRLVETLNFCV